MSKLWTVKMTFEFVVVADDVKAAADEAEAKVKVGADAAKKKY